MKRRALHLLALPIAWCITAHAAAQTGQQAGGAGADGPKVQLQTPVALREKTMAVGAELAEQWSPSLAAALSQNAALPTVQSQLELAHAYYSLGILDKASDLYEAVARREPRRAAAWDGMARIWRDWGYPQRGLGDAHRAVWADPRSPAARNTLGTILQLLGKSREAKMEFTRAASLDPAAAYRAVQPRACLRDAGGVRRSGRELRAGRRAGRLAGGRARSCGPRETAGCGGGGREGRKS